MRCEDGARIATGPAETTIVIPVWDSEEQFPLTKQLIGNILLLTGGSFMLVVVDNASPFQATKEFLAHNVACVSCFHLISNQENLGYGPALNQGLRFGYDQGSLYFVNMNNDVLITDSDWLEALVGPLRENPKRLVGARLIDWNEACDFDGTGPVPYLEGWCLAFARCFLDEVGYFHPDIMLWHEDVELTLRAKKHGYEILQSPAFEWRRNFGLPLRGPLIHLYGQTGFRKGLPFEEISAESREIVRREHFG